MKPSIHGLPPEEIERLKHQILGSSDIKARQYTQWATSFANTAAKLSQGWSSCPERVTVFWLRLHGVLTELTVHYAPQPWQAMTPELTAQYPDAAEILRRSHLVYQAALAVKDCLTEDEILYADLRRQTECHILQNGYELRLESKRGKNKLKDTYTVAALGKSFKVDELDTRIRAFLRPYLQRSRNGEFDASVDMAKKVAIAASRIVAAMKYVEEFRYTT